MVFCCCCVRFLFDFFFFFFLWGSSSLFFFITRSHLCIFSFINGFNVVRFTFSWGEWEGVVFIVIVLFIVTLLVFQPEVECAGGEQDAQVNVDTESTCWPFTSQLRPQTRGQLPLTLCMCNLLIDVWCPCCTALHGGLGDGCIIIYYAHLTLCPLLSYPAFTLALSGRESKFLRNFGWKIDYILKIPRTAKKFLPCLVLEKIIIVYLW